MRRLVIMLALALFLAGCVQPEAPEVDPTEAGTLPHWAMAALESTHDHTDPAAHANLTTPNFDVVGYAPLMSDAYGTTVQGNLCGDVNPTEDGRRLAAVETRGDVAFTLVDVTDPTDPQRLGEFEMPTTYIYDLAVVPDGKHVVLITSTHKNPDRTPTEAAAPKLQWRSACAEDGGAAWRDVPPAASAVEQMAPHPSSVLLVSIEDPSTPYIVDRKPIAGYGHGISSHMVDGAPWVAAAALGCAPAVSCASAAGNWHFYEVVDTPAGGQLEILNVWTPPVEVTSPDAMMRMGHNDAWLQEHPLTGQMLAYLVAWDLGLYILDVTDPSNPEVLSRWSDHDPSLPDDDRGNAHSAHPFMLDGRHYTVLGPEQPGKPETLPSGIVRVLDTTDPAHPEEVAAWTLPRDVVWEGRLMWSPHYLSVWNHTLFVSFYHAGVWALDLSGLGGDWHVLPAVGVFLPVNESPAPPERPFRWAPTLEEVHALDDGTLVTFDSNSGLYAFRFDESNPMPPPAPWDLEPAHG